MAKLRFRICLGIVIIIFCLIFISTFNLSSLIRSFLNIDQLEEIQKQLEQFDPPQSSSHKNVDHTNVYISPSPNEGQDMRGWQIIRGKITNTITRQFYKPPPDLVGPTNSRAHSMSGFLRVYIWWESCYSSVNAFKASLGFPHAPEEILKTRTLFIHRGRSYYAERIFGYIIPPVRGFYRFSLTSIAPIEVWLSSDSDPRNSKLVLSTPNAESDPTESDAPTDPPTYPSTLQSKSIYLHTRAYYIEILHLSTDAEDTFHLKWLPPGLPEFVYITKKHFKTSPIIPHPKLPSSLPMHVPVSNAAPADPEVRNLRVVPPGVYNKSFPHCYRLDSFAEPHTLLQYHGLYELERIRVYPDDGTQLYNGMQHQDGVLSISGNEDLTKDTRDSVVSVFLSQSASDLLALNLTFSRLNRIEMKQSKGVSIRYLIDISLQNTFTLEFSRLIDIFFLEGRYSSQLCLLPEYAMTARRTFVYFVIVVRNLGQPLKAFIQEMEKLRSLTGDDNFGLIVADFMSTDLNVSNLLSNSHLRHYKYISLSGPFIKVQGQNAALQAVKDDDVIICLFDLHINLPQSILHEVRAHTVKNVSAFAPIVFRLQCGHSLANPLGFWEVWGTGLFSMFRSDWKVLGGMDTDKYAQSWGGEDSDLLDRTLSLGFEVERKAIPGLVHFYHTRFGLWDV